MATEKPPETGAVFHVVTPNDIAKQAAALAQGSRFLFVDCNEQGGRPEMRVRPLLNRHVMLKHTFPGGGDETKVTPVDQKGLQRRIAHRSKREIIHRPAQHECSTAAAAPAGSRGRQTRPRSQPAAQGKPGSPISPGTITARQPYPSPSLSPDRRMDMVWRWWFDAPSDLPTNFNIARAHWVESAWDMARRSAAVYECVALYAARKKAQADGVWSEYVAQEARCIRSMAHEVQKVDSRPRPLLPVAIGVLAYLALLDGHVNIALTHLRAISALWDEYHFADTHHEWVYVVWLDLRFALHLRRAPVLAYYVPPHFRKEDWIDRSPGVREKSCEKASHCARHCPKVDRFDMDSATHLFMVIFQLFLTCTSLKSAEDTPFARVYDLDYRLCVLRAAVLPLSQVGAVTAHTCVELVLTAMQLHVWIVTRFWAPVGTASRRTLIGRVCQLVQSNPPSTIVSFWKDSASLNSLLWVLSCFSISAIEAGLDRSLAPLEALRLAVREMSISSLDRFLAVLREWPWLENWHHTRYTKLWKTIDIDKSSEDESDILALQQSGPVTVLGGLEFYDG